MLSSAVVVFREVFEIVLIVGIVLAATRGMPHRRKAIIFGFGGGLAGAALVAMFTGKISEFAEGMGQEYFNAGILFTAAIFIGWTLIWMKRHAHEMKANFTKLGQAVSDGQLPFISLSIVIALAIWREGSEIALFTYGMLAAGQEPLMLLTGSIIGLVGGALVGTLLYMGLIQLSMRHFFSVTSTILVLVVAGMMVQGIGFLTAAGAFENLSFTVWDSSWLLGEHGIFGQSLKVLIGYTARPSAIQIIVYILTIGTLFMFIKLSTKSVRSSATAAAVLALLLLPTQAHATKTVSSPYVTKGELEVEWKGGYDIDDDSDTDGAWKQKAAIGYAFTDYWYTEIEGEVEKEGESGADAEFTAVAWENKFQLTQPGQYWVDVGVKGELEYNTAGDADKAEVKLLLAKSMDKFAHKANLIAERSFGEDSEDETEFGFAWSTKYRLKPTFEPGFEWYSDFGALDDGSSFDEEKHQAGPVVYGKIGAMKYDVGYLFGVSDAAPDGSIKAILEYEWHF